MSPLTKRIAIPITQAQGQALIDAVFQAAEAVTGQPVVRTIEGMANMTLDALLPAIWVQLQASGIVTP